jgi:hypothetical protein
MAALFGYWRDLFNFHNLGSNMKALYPVVTVRFPVDLYNEAVNDSNRLGLSLNTYCLLRIKGHSTEYIENFGKTNVIKKKGRKPATRNSES